MFAHADSAAKERSIEWCKEMKVSCALLENLGSLVKA